MNIPFILQPEIGLVIVLMIILLADLFVKNITPRKLQIVSCLLMSVQVISLCLSPTGEAFGGMYASTPLISAVKSVLTIGTLLVFLQTRDWLERKDTRHKAGEFYVLTLSTLLGMYFMVSAGSFLMFYIGLELASIPMACLVAFDKFRHHSAEAGAKYILSSMFSSALMLYGLSMLYGTCGTVYFADLSSNLIGSPLQVLTLVFFFSGLGFKISLVPFHMWTPDVYQGAPTTVSGYLSVISKGAAAFSLATILIHIFRPMEEYATLLISIVAITTITLGNLFALLQSDMKRFMAYSSVSQAGYIILGILGGEQGITSLIYYITVYIVANLAIFGIIGAVEQQTGGNTSRNAYAGFYTTNPRLSFVMTLALFSLAGIPPFAGFFSKFFIFASAFHTGYWAVVFIALINTVVSLYYYLLIVKAIYLTPVCRESSNSFQSPMTLRLCLFLCTLMIITFGIISSIYESFINLSNA